MSEKIWSSSRLRRLDFGRLGGAKMEWIFAGALGLIIILSLVITLWPSDSTVGIGDAPKQHYVCVKCQHEFEKDIMSFSKEELGGGMRMPEAQGPAILVDCPSCKATQSCWPAIQCPECKKWFISQQDVAFMRYYVAQQPIPEGVWRIRSKCTHCGTVPYEWRMRQVPGESESETD